MPKKIRYHGLRQSRVVLYQKQNALCFYCGKDMEYFDCNIDHVLPRSKGGDKKGNIVVAHIECNIAKANRLPTDDELRRAKELGLTKFVAVPELFHRMKSNKDAKRDSRRNK